MRLSFGVWSFFISTLLHSVLILFLFWGLEPRKNSPESMDFEIDLNEKIESSKPISKTSTMTPIKKKPINKKLNSHFSKTFKDLSPSALVIPDQAKQGQNFNSGNQGLDIPDNSSAPWGQGGQEFDRIQDYRNQEVVAFTVDKMLEFPHQLAYRKMGGVVKARLVINDKGQCEWGPSFINGNNPYFRFYILTVLKDFCRGDFWHGLKKRKSSNLDFSFHFDTYAKKKRKTIINGNVILMHFPGHQFRGDWKLGPIQGNFLFPNSVMLNPTWILETWNSLVHDEDPLQRFKEREEK
jgi:hypothetical protein